MLAVPHFLKLGLVHRKPFSDKFLGFAWKIALKHFHSSDVKFSHVFSIQSMNVAWLMLLRFEKHLDNNSVKACDLRHNLVHPLCISISVFTDNVNSIPIIITNGQLVLLTIQKNK